MTREVCLPGSTVYVYFDTFDAGTGASLTMTGLAVTDIEIYKDGNTTQRASDSGYTLLDTDGTDIDGVTGFQGFSIDLADNTTAGFYAAGSDYAVVVSSVTIDGQTVNFVAKRFTIGYPNALINTTIATLSSQTSFTLTSGPAEDDALNGMWVWMHDVASAVQCGRAVISDYTGSTKTVTLAAGTTFTAAATDNISIMGPAPLEPTTAGAKLDVTATGAAGIDWSNVENQSTSVNLSGTTTNLVNTTTTNTDMRGTDSALLAASAPTNFGDLAITATTGRVDVASIEGSDATNQIRDAVVDDATRIDASALNTASAATGSNGAGLTEAGGTGDHLTALAMAAKLLAYVQLLARSDAAIETDNAAELTEINADGGSGGGDYSAQTDSGEAVRDHIGDGTNLTEAGGNGDHLTEAGGDGDHLTTLSTSAALITVDSNVDAIKAKTDSLTFTVANQVDANVVAISGDTTAADNLEESATAIQLGSAITGTLSTTQMTTNLAETTDDHYIGRIIVWTSGVLKNQATDITDYTGSSKLLTFTEITEAPSNGDTFVIL